MENGNDEHSAAPLCYTPGPWKVERNHHGKVFGVSGPTMKCDLDFVCELSEYRNATPDAVERNARLIAAAPDLLAHLKHMIWLVETEFEMDGGHIVEHAKAAVAKAECV